MANPLVCRVQIPLGGISLDLWSGQLGPQIAAHGNSVYVVFESYGEGIFCSRSLDGGQSFDLPVSTVDLEPGRYATLPTITTDNDGNPIVGFITTNASEQDANYEVAVSQDGGVSFLPTTTVDPPAAGETPCECCPASMVVDTDDNLYVSYRNNIANVRDMWVAKIFRWRADF